MNNQELTKRQKQYLRVAIWLDSIIESKAILQPPAIYGINTTLYYDFNFKDNINAILYTLPSSTYNDIKDDKKHLYRLTLDTNTAFTTRTVNGLSESPMLEGVFSAYMEQELGINTHNMFEYINYWITQRNTNITTNKIYCFQLQTVNNF